MRIEGHVHCILRSAAYPELILGEWKFRNLITNTGLDAYFSNTNNATLPFGAPACIAAGTGNTTPANGDTALVSEFSAQRTNTDGTGQSGVTYVSASPDYFRALVSRRFSTSQANGNIAELGIFSATSGSTMYARALPKDGNGNPTVIVKNSSMVLDVIWEIRWIPIQTDVTETVTIGGVSTSVTYRAVGCNNGGSWNAIAAYGICFTTNAGVWYTASAGLITRTSNPPVCTLVPFVTELAYTSGTFFRDQKLQSMSGAAVIFAACNANISSFGTQAFATAQISLSPATSLATTIRSTLARS